MLDTPEPLLTLAHLRLEMTAKGYSAKQLARLVPIPINDITDLMSADPRRVREPWLWEAAVMARTLGISTICTLIGETLDEITTWENARGDLAVWRTGCPLPLSYAVRLCRRFGLSDPYDLYEVIRLRLDSPIISSVWNMAPASGACRSCLYEEGHADTCVPNFLWGPRAENIEATIVTAPKPRRNGVRQGGSHLAPGLKALRERLGRTQQNMADNLGCSLAHWSKLENMHARLTFDNAEVLRRKFQVTPADLYAVPDAAPDVEPAEEVETA